MGLQGRGCGIKVLAWLGEATASSTPRANEGTCVQVLVWALVTVGAESLRDNQGFKPRRKDMTGEQTAQHLPGKY